MALGFILAALGGCSGGPGAVDMGMPDAMPWDAGSGDAGDTQCFAAADLSPCDDGDARTIDACIGGECVGRQCSGVADECHDARLTVDGCESVPRITGSGCDDGDPDTYGDACGIDAVCRGTECVSSQCTERIWDGGRCVVTHLEGERCDDGDEWTRSDRCDASGQCAGVVMDCWPGSGPCCSDSGTFLGINSKCIDASTIGVTCSTTVPECQGDLFLNTSIGDRFCSGASSSCNGEIVEMSSVSQSCPNGSTCVDDGNGGACVPCD